MFFEGRRVFPVTEESGASFEKLKKSAKKVQGFPFGGMCITGRKSQSSSPKTYPTAASVPGGVGASFFAPTGHKPGF